MPVPRALEAIDSPTHALPHYQRAAETQQELFRHSPDSRELATALGKTLNALGDASLRLGQLDEANAYFQRATNGQHVEAQTRLQESQLVLSQLVKEEPSNEQYTSQLQLTRDETARVTANRA